MVILYTSDYLRDIYRQLNDPIYYLKKDYDMTSEVSDKLRPVLTKMLNKSLIDPDIFDLLDIQDPRACKLYMLPKIRKKGIPGRPICSSLGHPTNRISSFMDAHMKDYVPLTSSYLRDTQHFIKRILSIPPLLKGHLVATMDVVSLYTNIPNH